LPRFILSCSRSSSEFLRSSLPPIPFREQAYCQGFVPLRDVTGCVHSTRGFQVLDMFRPQVLSTSRRLSPQASSTGLFHPAAASRAFRSFRGFPSPRSDRFLVGTICPLAVARRPLGRTNPVGHGRRPRLRGFNPRRSSRTTRPVVSRPRGRAPLRVSTPPGLIFPPRSRLIRDLRS